MEYVWNMNGIGMEYESNLCGICMGYVWSRHCIRMEYAGICVEAVSHVAYAECMEDESEEADRSHLAALWCVVCVSFMHPQIMGKC